MSSTKRRHNGTNLGASSPFRILMYSTKEHDRMSFDAKLKELKQPELYELNYTCARLSSESVMQAKGHACVCLSGNDDGSRAVLEELKRIGVNLIVFRCADGNHLDFKAADELRIEIGYVPSSSPYAVAEHAIALLVALNRRLPRAYNRVRAGDFRLEGLVGSTMHGKTVGVLGTGRTGQFTIRIFRGFACRVLAFDTHPIRDKDRQALSFEYTDLDDLYAQADIICIQLPVDTKTKHLINSQSIAKMRRGVILINTARGDLIDSKALLDALRSGQVGGVGLDVYENEEKYFSNDFSSSMVDDQILVQLIAHPNVILTARQAFLTDEALSSIAKATMENIHAFLNSRKPLHSPEL